MRRTPSAAAGGLVSMGNSACVSPFRPVIQEAEAPRAAGLRDLVGGEVELLAYTAPQAGGRGAGCEQWR
ncbi:hypothetical protein [Streptomyces collinus]|uniref:Uncharacterized protein n=1 Tax=Streptomyces collinus TaxID=42684 RepID=A0AA89QD55_STRCU|nr:hypothetical protein [Streptomyces collinus]MBB5816345.1 hypothetical protein [Streptomyces collinus]MBB5816872.1 hypothetical protein [Streptomyces collinus]WMX61893.1 hypothetical protein RFN52_00320 [Streptomyces collinus]